MLSFKNDLVSLIYIFYFGVKMPKDISTELYFFLINTFRSHNKLFLYKINTQRNGRLNHFITCTDYTSRSKPPPTRTHSAQTSIQYKTTRCENMIAWNHPDSFPSCLLKKITSVTYCKWHLLWFWKKTKSLYSVYIQYVHVHCSGIALPQCLSVTKYLDQVICMCWCYA